MPTSDASVYTYISWLTCVQAYTSLSNRRMLTIICVEAASDTAAEMTLYTSY